MLRTVCVRPTLLGSMLPPQALVMPPELTAVVVLLDDARFFEPFRRWLEGGAIYAHWATEYQRRTAHGNRNAMPRRHSRTLPCRRRVPYDRRSTTCSWR